METKTTQPGQLTISIMVWLGWYSHKFGLCGQTPLAATNRESQHRLQRIDSVVTPIVKIPVLNTQSVKNIGQLLWVLVLDVVLLNALVVDYVKQTGQGVYVDIDAEEEVDVLLDIVPDYDDLAEFAVGVLR